MKEHNDNDHGEGSEGAAVPERDTPTSSTHKETLEEKLRKKYLAEGQGIKPPPDLRVIVLGDSGTPKLSMIRLHKDLFVMASPYFSSLLSEVDVSIDGTYSVRLQIQSRVFWFLKHFLYVDDLPDQIIRNNYSTIPLDITMKLKILEASVQFEMDRLTTKIISKIKQNMKIGHAFKLLQSSRELDLRDMESYSLDIINKNAEDLLSNSLEDFCTLGSFDVCRILSSDSLQCKEVTVFNAALRWAKEKAKYTQEPTMHKAAMKYYFNQIAACVRFPLLSPTELAQVTKGVDVLDSHDLVKLFQYVCLPEAERDILSPNFESKPRCKRGGFERKRMPPPSPSLSNGSSCWTPIMKRRRHSDDTVVVPSATKKGAKRICFPEGQESDDSSDEDLFIATIRKCDKSVVSYEELARKCLGEAKRSSVGSIEFTNISIKQPYCSTVLENCKDLKVDVKLNFIQENSKSRVDDIKDFVRNFNPMRYLVFPTKDTLKPLSAADIWSLKQNILLKFNGVTFLNVYHASGQSESTRARQSLEGGDKLVMNYIRDSCDILKNDQLKPTTLAMSNCEFSLQKMKDRGRQEGLKRLILYHVWGDFTADEIMKECPNLTELILWKYTPKQQTNVPNLKGAIMTPLSMNFNNLFSARQTIRKIVLFEAELKFPARSVNLATTVSELHLDRCHVAPISGRGTHIAEVFHLIFPKLQRFLLIEDSGSNQNIAKPVLISSVRKMETIKWFRVVGLKWEPDSPNMIQDSHAYKESENQCLSTFLQECDIASNSTNFLLEKNNNCWKGTDYEETQREPTSVDGGYNSSMDQLEYDWYSLNHFFDNCQVFEDYFINTVESFPKPILWV